MENNQSVQQESSKVKESAPIPEKKNSESKNRINSFKNAMIYLFMHYPWLFLAGLLLMFLGGGALSIYSLGNVGESIESKESDTIQAEVAPLKKSAETVASNENSIPLWMVAAITISCATGCLVLLRFINRPRQKQKLQKRIVNREQIRLAQRRYQAMEARLPKKAPVYPNRQRRNTIMAVPPQRPKPKPVVTVLPPEQSFKPNQKNQDSLADTLDIRKQTSLSSMLRK